MNKLAQKVAEKAQKSLGTSGFFFEQLDISPNKFVVSPISADSFSSLATIATQQPILFVDGGNNTLVDSPSLHVSALRVAIVKQFFGNQRIKFSATVHDAACTITLEKVDGKKKYVIEVDSEVATPSFSPIELDDELIARVDENRIMITLCNYVRQSLELFFATQSLSDLSAGSLLVLDGSLSSRSKQLPTLVASASQKNVLVVAVSKSTAITTTGGYAVCAFLMQHSPYQHMWMTSVLAQTTKDAAVQFAIHFAKLATKSEHVVRIDVAQDSNSSFKPDIAKVMGILAWASQDASFPGYPYGLIKADDLARISQEEKEYLTTRLLLQLDPLTQNQIRLLSASSSAHSVLDSLKF